MVLQRLSRPPLRRTPDRKCRATALERSKEAFALGHRNAHAVVDHFQSSHLSVGSEANLDRRSSRGVARRILKQVGHDLVHLAIVARHQWEILGDRQLDLAAG